MTNESHLNQTLPPSPPNIAMSDTKAHLPHFGFMNAGTDVAFWTPDVIRQLVANLTYLLDEFDKNPPPEPICVLVRFGHHGFDIFSGPANDLQNEQNTQGKQ